MNPLAKSFRAEGAITQELDGRLTFYQGSLGGMGGVSVVPVVVFVGVG